MWKLFLCLLFFVGAVSGFEDCSDDHENCWRWESYCKNPRYSGWMENNCPMTCGLCPMFCVDMDEECEKNVFDFDPECLNSTNMVDCCGSCKKSQFINDAMTGVCGVSTLKGVKGEGSFEALYGSVPWQVFLPIDLDNDKYCGGVLVSETHVLTAAHCLENFGQNPDDFYVYLGKHRKNITLVDEGELKVKVKTIMKHESYNEDTVDFDVALITLENKVDFTDYIRPICINTAQNYPSEAQVFGWGEKIGGGTSNKLQGNPVSIMENSECEEAHEPYSQGINYITENMICALSKSGKDACEGDSGGPLLHTAELESGESVTTVYGLVSWGYGCGEDNTPGVYTRIDALLDWIILNMYSASDDY